MSKKLYECAPTDEIALASDIQGMRIVNVPMSATTGTYAVALIDRAYNNVTQNGETVLSLTFPESIEGLSRKFYLVYNCSNEGQTEMFFDVALETEVIVANGDTSIFNPSVGTNIYKFEEVAYGKFLVSRVLTSGI